MIKVLFSYSNNIHNVMYIPLENLFLCSYQSIKLHLVYFFWWLPCQLSVWLPKTAPECTYILFTNASLHIYILEPCTTIVRFLYYKKILTFMLITNNYIIDFIWLEYKLEESTFSWKEQICMYRCIEKNISFPIFIDPYYGKWKLSLAVRSLVA